MEFVKLNVFFFLFVIFALIYFSIKRAEKIAPEIKKFAALEAVDEAVGRAVELGAPIHYTIGWAPGAGGGGLNPNALAGLSILGYVAEKSARVDAHLITTYCNPILSKLYEETLKSAFISAGKEGEPDLRFISSNQFSYTTGVMQILAKENVAVQFVMGDPGASAIHFVESGARFGCMQITGSSMLVQIPFMVAGSDYSLIGEEFLAASAVVADDRSQLGSIIGADIAKFIIIGILVLGTILAQLGITFPYELIKPW